MKPVHALPPPSAPTGVNFSVVFNEPTVATTEASGALDFTAARMNSVSPTSAFSIGAPNVMTMLSSASSLTVMVAAPNTPSLNA